MANLSIADKYIKDRLEPQIEWYDKKSMHNQKWAKRYHVSIITLSAATPILAALDYKWATIGTSSVVTIAIGILKYYKFEELWQSYRTTCETLKKEKVMFESKTEVYKNAPEPDKLFVERAESLISKENTAWINIVNQKEKISRKKVD